MNTKLWLNCCFAVQDSSFKALKAPKGSIALEPFQRAAVHRAYCIIKRRGGVILADGVGFGKTRMGLALAELLWREQVACRVPLVGPVYCCVPARLTPMWKHTIEQFEVFDSIKSEKYKKYKIITHTQLSRYREKLEEHELPSVLLVDEAHQFRNPMTKRYAYLSELGINTPVILLTATPICNTIWDVYHLLRLFLADHHTRDFLGLDMHRVFSLAEFDNRQRENENLVSLLEHTVIQRAVIDARERRLSYPEVDLMVKAYKPAAEEKWIWDHLADVLDSLTLALFCGDWPRVLFKNYLIRRWESSPSALDSTLKYLIEFHRRWLRVSCNEKSLSRLSFRALIGSKNVLEQELLPFMYDGAVNAVRGEELDAMRCNAMHDLQILIALQQRIREVQTHALSGLIQLVSKIARSEKTEKVLIFTSYRHAAQGIFHSLQANQGAHARIGLITGNTARATGIGRSTAQDIITRFSPRANGHPELPHHQQIHVLVATDCISTGQNLQDCSHLVLADLPYSALRLEQRIGRLARPGALRSRVSVYLPRPRDWQDPLGLKQRLLRKVQSAERAGIQFSTFAQNAQQSPLAARAELSAIMNSMDALSDDEFVGESPHYFRVDGSSSHCVSQRALLVAVMIMHHTRELRWWLIRGDGTIVQRLGSVLPTIKSLLERPQAIQAGFPDADLHLYATKAVHERQTHLRGAQFAPLPVDVKSPQYMLWQSILEEKENSRIDVTRHEMDLLRKLLLRPFPVGMERRIRQWSDENIAIPDLIECLQGWTSKPERFQPLRLSIYAAIQM